MKPLREGCRLHCFVDACKGVFALGLPSCTYTRADGWSSWEVRSHCLAALPPLVKTLTVTGMASSAVIIPCRSLDVWVAAQDMARSG